jgi:broad specificity phosphatase PhoE
LARAYETARIIADGRHVERDRRWREFDFGAWEGLTAQEIGAGAYSPRTYEPPGGETFATMRARIREALDDLQRRKLQHALVVTHAGPLHAMLHEFFGEIDVRFAPASLTQIGWDGAAAELLVLNAVVRAPAK